MVTRQPDGREPLTERPEPQNQTRITGAADLAATWFGAGLLPRAPGTWGSLVALPLAWGLHWLGGPPLLTAAILAVFMLGLWSADVYGRRTGREDASEIVIDEVVGQWIAVLAVPPALIPYAAGFLLFRAFDILKPWPISWVEKRFRGGLGVMADDVLAGLFAAILLYALQTWFGGFLVFD